MFYLIGLIREDFHQEIFFFFLESGFKENYIYDMLIVTNLENTIKH